MSPAAAAAPGPDVVIVLPPRERFAPHSAGAIALLVHQTTKAPSRYRRLVAGSPCDHPFDDVAFIAVRQPHGLWSSSRRYAAALARQVGTPAMIEVHNRPNVALHLARLLPDAKITLILHNDPLTMRGLRSAAERSLAARSLAGCIVVSAYLATRLSDAGFPHPTIIPNGIDLAHLPPRPDTRENLILFAGRIVADKGADAFVAAIAQALPTLPGWRAEMIGADRFTAESPVTPFIRRLAPAAAAANITLPGYRPHAEILATMARAAIVVVPSRWQEPFGMTALEAMASGAALICSNRGGLADLTAGTATPCDPDTPATIAAAITRLATHPTERTTQAAAALARAQHFDIRQTAAQLDAYRDAVASTRADKH